MRKYHIKISQNELKTTKLRHGDSLQWVGLEHVKQDAPSVKALQTFLINAGIFPPDTVADGFFGYGTLAGVRLFQEYVRAYEGKDKFWPDGIVGKGTWSVMLEWQKAKKMATKWARNKPSFEYTKALELLNQGKAYFLDLESKEAETTDSNEILLTSLVSEKVEAFNKESNEKVDTLRTKDWTFQSDDVHLIGIRRKEDESGKRRENDDVFVLLISGMIFIFRGSTDPNIEYVDRNDEAFLVEGQHKFKFGWHKHSKGGNQSYQGLNPYGRGVLVFRDRDNTNKLTIEDINKENAIAPPNTSINIHWTGDGSSGSWSAGCQVLVGTHYFDNEGTLQNLHKFSAVAGSHFKANSVNRVKLSKAAYNIFTDLVLLYGPKNKDYILYTLTRDESFDIDFLKDLGMKDRLNKTLTNLGLSDESGNLA